LFLHLSHLSHLKNKHIRVCIQKLLSTTKYAGTGGTGGSDP